MKTWYYYLHTNGELISKNPAVVDADPDYFKSDFVKKFWKIDLESRVDPWVLILEALENGASAERCKVLAEKWGLTRDESLIYLEIHKPTVEQREGLKKFVINVLKEDPNEYIAWVLANQKEKTPAAAPPANGKPTPATAVPEPPKASPPPLPQPQKKAAAQPATPTPEPTQAPAEAAYTPEIKLQEKPQPPAPAPKPPTAPAATKENSELLRLQQYDKFLVDTEALRITKTEEAQVVKDFIDKARTFIKDAEAATKPEIDETKIRYDAARAKRDAMLKPLKAADAFANRILTDWLVEVKRREIEAQRKADDDRRKIEAEARRKADEAAKILRDKAEADRITKAAEAKADGKEAEAQRILETPIVIEKPKPEIIYTPAPLPAPDAAKPSGTGLRETWVWELLDINDVPEMFTKKVVDEDLVDAVVSKKKGETNIPGIHAFPKNTTVHRSAK